jgi:hypothetical protein
LEIHRKRQDFQIMIRRPLFAFTAFLLASAAMPGSSLAQEAAAGRIRSVVLFSGGVAEIVREADVVGDASVGIEIPIGQVNDVLKSLVVRNPGGTVGQISLEGPDGSLASGGSTPLTGDDVVSVVSLLSRIRGTEVRISGDRVVEGKVLGVQVFDDVRIRRGETAPESRLPVVSLLTEAGDVRSVEIGPEVTVDILDAAVSERVAAAAGRLGRSFSEESRLVSVRTTGTGSRKVEIDYVVEAPVWKSSHRLVVGEGGKGRLQTWAVVENASGEDWKDVDVSLSSGSPVTLRQNLYEPFRKPRQEVPVFVDSQTAPQADGGSVPAAAMDSGMLALAAPAQSRGFGAMAEAMPAAPAMAKQSRAFEMSAAAGVPQAVQGDVSVLYAVPSPVDLVAGSTLSVPVVDAEVPAERISVFDPRRGTIHPTAAVKLENATGSALPAGIVTVYDAGGYVGDSTLLPVPGGDERLVQFALDRKISVNTTEKPEDSIDEIAVSDGILRYRSTMRRATTYAAKNIDDAERKLSVEHPKMPGWEFASKDKVSETQDAFRLERTIPAGGTVQIEAAYTFVQGEQFALVDADTEQLLRFSKLAPEGAVKAKLAELADNRSKAASIERRLGDIEQRRAEISSEQDRLRQNIGAVGASDLRDRYLEKLAGQETELEAISAETAKHREELDKIRSEGRAIVRSL